MYNNNNIQQLTIKAMKFFLEWMSCFGQPFTSRSSVPPSPSQLFANETTFLVTSPSSQQRRRKKRHAGSFSGFDWTPSLFSISEDDFVVEKRHRYETKPRKSCRFGMRKSGHRRSHNLVRSIDSDDFGWVMLSA